MTDLKEIFIKNDFEKLLELKSSGELFAAIPEFEECFSCPQNNKHHCYNVGEHIFESVRIAMEMRYEPVVCMTMLLHDIGKPVVRHTDENGVDHFYEHAQSSYVIAEDILHGLDMFGGDDEMEILLLIRDHDRFNGNTKTKTLKKYMGEYGAVHCRRLAQVRYCDTMSQSAYEREEKMKKLRDFRELIEEFFADENDL